MKHNIYIARIVTSKLWGNCIPHPCSAKTRMFVTFEAMRVSSTWDKSRRSYPYSTKPPRQSVVSAGKGSQVAPLVQFPSLFPRELMLVLKSAAPSRSSFLSSTSHAVLCGCEKKTLKQNIIKIQTFFQTTLFHCARLDVSQHCGLAV